MNNSSVTSYFSKRQALVYDILPPGKMLESDARSVLFQTHKSTPADTRTTRP